MNLSRYGRSRRRLSRSSSNNRSIHVKTCDRRGGGGRRRKADRRLASESARERNKRVNGLKIFTDCMTRLIMDTHIHTHTRSLHTLQSRIPERSRWWRGSSITFRGLFDGRDLAGLHASSRNPRSGMTIVVEGWKTLHYEKRSTVRWKIRLARQNSSFGLWANKFFGWCPY